MSKIEAITKSVPNQDELYQEAANSFASALGRLARAYEADAESCQDLLQEIHIALWRSFATFDGKCSMRTWVYRVAHNVAASHILRDRRTKARGLVSLETIDTIPDKCDAEEKADRNKALERLQLLIQRLEAIDREVILLYLEGTDAASIAEITGMSAGNVATKIHRIKNILVRRFHEGESHD